MWVRLGVLCAAVNAFGLVFSAMNGYSVIAALNAAGLAINALDAIVTTIERTRA